MKPEVSSGIKICSVFSTATRKLKTTKARSMKIDPHDQFGEDREIASNYFGCF